MEGTGKLLLLYALFLPLLECAVPGTFFWKPRLGLDLAIPSTEMSSSRTNKPTKENIQAGIVVLIDGYSAGMTAVGVASGAANAKTMPHFDITSAYFYTHAYRWVLKYASLLPHWLSGAGGNFVETHKVWRRRFFYMDELMPKWMQKALFYVDQDSWKKEEHELKQYKKFSESAFGKYFKYPSKNFNDWLSLATKESRSSEQPSHSFDSEHMKT